MDFWKNSSKWPHDMVDAVFLARAFHSIGEAMFGPAWTGEEPSFDPPLSKPGALRARFATDALRVQAEMALERMQQRYDAVWPLYNRAQQVQTAIATRAAAGELKTKLRPVAGGQLMEVPAHHWATEKLRPRFAWCQMSLASPFSDGMAGKGYGYIFVERASLEKFLSEISSPTRHPGGAVKASLETGTSQEPQAKIRESDDAASASPVAKLRRQVGNVSLASADAPLISEMHDLIERRIVSSIIAAAWKVVDRAAGGGSPESKVDRLRRRYSEAYPLQEEQSN